MVNSPRWVRPPSPSRQTRASWKIGPAPATSSRFIANSGLVCSQRSRPDPSGACCRVRQARRCTSSPGTGTAYAVSTSV